MIANKLIKATHTASGDYFLNDTLDLFRGVRTGHMNPYAFNEPDPAISNDPVRGGQHWNDFIAANPHYYTVNAEADCIQQNAQLIANLLPTDLISVEFGPGEGKAIRTKTLPFNQAISPSQYVSIDVNSVYAHQAASLLQEANIASDFVVADFFHDNLNLPEGRKAFSLFGGLLCNIPAIRGKGPVDVLQSTFALMRDHFEKGDYLVITQDACHDVQKLEAAYDHPVIGQYILSVLHKIKRDLNTTNFNPYAFEFAMRYDERQHCVTLGFVADKPQSFKIEDEAYTIPAGKVISLVNSYKFPHPDFVTAACSAGFKVVRSFNCNQATYVHVLQSI